MNRQVLSTGMIAKVKQIAEQRGIKMRDVIPALLDEATAPKKRTVAPRATRSPKE